MTDLARNQAVYVDENGNRIDIVSQEPDGSTVSGTQALGLAVIPDPGSSQGGPARSMAGSNGEQLRAIVIGTRSDGRGGVWTVLGNGTVLPAGQESGSGNSSSLPECDDRDHGLHGWMGWTYVVTDISDDGLMIVGNAINKKGFHHGGVDIDPNTTVGVYWRVKKISHRPHIQLTAARVIGTLDTSKLPGRGHWKKRLESLLLKRLAHLQLFFLDYFSAYLSAADNVSYDLRRDLYVVTGQDQDGDDATATIDRTNTIVITATTPPTGQADLVVSAIQVPSTAQTTSAAWTLGATVTNTGTDNAGAFTLLYQLSTKSTLDATATLIGTSTVTGLAAGGTYTDTWSSTYSIPQGGTHWIFVTADSTNAVAESNEGNNISSASVPIIYPHIVIDTYNPVYGGAAVMPWVSLFGSSGDTTTESPDLWNTDQPPYTTETSAIAEDGALGLYGRVDYAGGLAPGTYYVRVRGLTSTQNGAYGIRVLDTSADNPTGPSWPWYFAATNPTDANPVGGFYEPDDNPLQGGVPTNPVPITLNGKLNRWLTPGNVGSGTPGDVDWFVLTLP